MALVAALATLATSASWAQEPLDVLFIAIDDLNDWVGVLDGHPQTKTPNIDRLAARGVTFLSAYSPSAQCNPVRTALLTGLRPSTTGIYGNDPDWRGLSVFDGVATLPRYFRDNGYQTLGAGKIFHAHTFSPGATAGYNDTTAWNAFYPALDIQLPDEVVPLRRPVNGNPDFLGFDWAPLVTDDRAMGDGQVTAWVERQLVAETGSPRFIAAGIFRPHLPWYLPQKYFDMHPLEDIILPATLPNDLDDVPEIARAGGPSSQSLKVLGMYDWAVEADKWHETVQAYLASVSFADAMVGRIIDALDRSGRSDNTIIVLWSDHGYHLGEKQRFRKMTLWEESTHVPLIIIAPNVAEPGTQSPRVVSTMDIYPTLAELAGLPVPAHIEGRSLVPLLENPYQEWDYPAVTTFEFGEHAVRTERHRYIRYLDGSEELYDHANDPNEWHNLAGDPAYADVIATLAASLPAVNAPNLANAD